MFTLQSGQKLFDWLVSTVANHFLLSPVRIKVVCDKQMFSYVVIQYEIYQQIMACF